MLRMSLIGILLFSTEAIAALSPLTTRYECATEMVETTDVDADSTTKEENFRFKLLPHRDYIEIKRPYEVVKTWSPENEYALPNGVQLIDFAYQGDWPSMVQPSKGKIMRAIATGLKGVLINGTLHSIIGMGFQLDVTSGDFRLYQDIKRDGPNTKIRISTGKCESA